MPKPIEHPGSFESTTNAASYTDLAGAYLDLDAGGTFAQVGAKGPGSIGTKIRTVLAGVAFTVLTFTAPGVATFLENVNMSSGKTFAAQAITATTITGTGIIRNDGASGGFAMGVISSVPRITYNSSTTSFAFLTGGNGDATLTTGHLYAESDAIFDIGQSTSLLRYRNLFLSGDISLASGRSVYLNALHNAALFESAVNVVDLWSAGTRSMAWSGGGVYLTSIGTTASAANVFTDAANSGLMARSTSSRKYKTDIAPLSLDEARNAVFGTHPVRYRSTSKLDDPERWFVGVIAEEMFRTDPRFVHLYDGKPDGVMYDRLVAPLLLVIQDQDERIKQLEAGRS